MNDDGHEIISTFPDQGDHRHRLERRGPGRYGQGPRRARRWHHCSTSTIRPAGMCGGPVQRPRPWRAPALPVCPPWAGSCCPCPEASGPFAAAAASLAAGGSGAARLALIEAPLDDELVAALRSAGTSQGPRIVVRSSSPLEAEGAWSGAFTSYTDATPEDLPTLVRGCWASAFNLDVLERWQAAGLDAGQLAMAVLIPARARARRGRPGDDRAGRERDRRRDARPARRADGGLGAGASAPSLRRTGRSRSTPVMVSTRRWPDAWRCSAAVSWNGCRLLASVSAASNGASRMASSTCYRRSAGRRRKPDASSATVRCRVPDARGASCRRARAGLPGPPGRRARAALGAGPAGINLAGSNSAGSPVR